MPTNLYWIILCFVLNILVVTAFEFPTLVHLFEEWSLVESDCNLDLTFCELTNFEIIFSMIIALLISLTCIIIALFYLSCYDSDFEMKGCCCYCYPKNGREGAFSLGTLISEAFLGMIPSGLTVGFLSVLAQFNFDRAECQASLSDCQKDILLSGFFLMFLSIKNIAYLGFLFYAFFHESRNNEVAPIEDA
jgi:hypothetical protein